MHITTRWNHNRLLYLLAVIRNKNDRFILTTVPLETPLKKTISWANTTKIVVPLLRNAVKKSIPLINISTNNQQTAMLHVGYSVTH